MANEENIVSYTMDEIRAMIARGESKTDWEKFRSITEEELEALIKADPDDIWLTDEELRGDAPAPLSIVVDADLATLLPADPVERAAEVNKVLRRHFSRRARAGAKTAA